MLRKKIALTIKLIICTIKMKLRVKTNDFYLNLYLFFNKKTSNSFKKFETLTEEFDKIKDELNTSK